MLQINTSHWHNVDYKSTAGRGKGRQEAPDVVSLRESSPSGKATGCVVPTTGHCAKGRAKKTLKRPGVPAVPAGGREGNQTEDFRGGESALGDPIRTGHFCHTLVHPQPTERPTPGASEQHAVDSGGG